jgi:uncharacterized protein
MLTPIAPNSKDFFDTFDQLAECAVEASACFATMLENFTDAPAQARRVDELEHRGDELTHRAIAMSYRSFVAPIERGNIQSLVSHLDDIVDLVDSAVRRVMLYGIRETTPSLNGLARVLQSATLEIQKAVRGLRRMKSADGILKPCVEVNRLENEGDDLRDEAVSALFRGEHSAVDVLRWKDVYEDVESAIDRCEDVADVLVGVVLAGA